MPCNGRWSRLDCRTIDKAFPTWKPNCLSQLREAFLQAALAGECSQSSLLRSEVSGTRWQGLIYRCVLRRDSLALTLPAPGHGRSLWWGYYSVGKGKKPLKTLIFRHFILVSMKAKAVVVAEGQGQSMSLK